MVKWGPNGRPTTDGKPSWVEDNLKKESYIEIINNEELIDNNMQINILGRLLSKTNKHPIVNAKIEVVDNNKLVKILKTSAKGYFIFYGGYIGRYHTFMFYFRGNDNFESCDKSLIII